MGDVATAAIVRGPKDPAHRNMIWIPGGTFRMGSDKHYAEVTPSIASARAMRKRWIRPRAASDFSPGKQP